MPFLFDDREPIHPAPEPAPALLHPARALLSPAWLAALGILVLNDHVLKGSGLLPGALTGKLSDFAGLMVAPALFAAVLRVRTERGLAACHAAVGLVFAAIQLSGPAADLWASAMAGIGFPWAITRDPSDLVALLVLPVAWHGLLPSMRRPLATHVRHVGEFAAAGLGLLACVATSPPPEPGWDWPEEFESFEATVHINNASDGERSIRLRELRADVQVNCFELAQDPGALLADAAFGETITWLMPARTNVPAWSGDWRECYAVLLDGDGFDPVVLFWSDGDLSPSTFVPGQTFEGEPLASGGVAVRFDPEGNFQGLDDGGRGLVHQRELEPVGQDDSCVPGSDGDRLDWSSGTFGGERYLVGLDVGIDGCWAMDLAPSAEAVEGAQRLYVCIPGLEPPFAAGDTLLIDYPTTGTYQGIDLRRLDNGVPDGTRLAASRGTTPMTPDGVEVVVSPQLSCAAVVDETCGNASLAASLIAYDIEGLQVELFAGERADFSSAEHQVSLMNIHASQRLVVAPDCGEGVPAVDADIELAFVETPQ